MTNVVIILEPAYGNNLEVNVWEGLPDGQAPLIEESRRSVPSFAMAVGILGFIVLATSSIGIFSVMLVEALGRARESGLPRALGTTRAGIQRFFLGQALLYSLFGSVIGVGLAIGLYRTVGAFVAPLFDSAGSRTGINIHRIAAIHDGTLDQCQELGMTLEGLVPPRRVAYTAWDSTLTPKGASSRSSPSRRRSTASSRGTSLSLDHGERH